jgi:hypothetical protein
MNWSLPFEGFDSLPDDGVPTLEWEPIEIYKVVKMLLFNNNIHTKHETYPAEYSSTLVT